MSQPTTHSRPLSRFQEHFDYIMPPVELLDSVPGDPENSKQTKSLTPLYGLSKTMDLPQLDMKSVTAELSSPLSARCQTKPPDLPIKLTQSKSQPAVRTTIKKDTQTRTNTVRSKYASDNYQTIKRTMNRNRADFIIKRYESWHKFILLLSTWMSDLAKQSSQSERNFSTMLKENRTSGNFGNDISSPNSIHAALRRFTKDLVSQEQHYSQRLKGFFPLLDSYKKECSSAIKQLGSRNDLCLDEFLKRAGATASLMGQLTRACAEAHSAIEKGIQPPSDPWLINLYVLRQLKKEVDEENRLRTLMIPVQQTISCFEKRLLKCVEQAIQICFEKYGALLSEDKVASLQASLNLAVQESWDSFAAKNKKQLVDEQHPHKHYLHINYSCKNDPLVLTLYKGEMERRSGILNKYTLWFFVLTESGFLHQFRLNDKVSPELSIYIPKSTIVPSIGIFNMNPVDLEQFKGKPYTFEIQCPGSSMLRDKTYTFRTSSLEEMIAWCSMLDRIANNSLDLIPKQQTNRLSTSISEKPSTLQIHETTPPSSPFGVLNMYNPLLVSPVTTPESSPISLKSESFFS